MDLTNTSKHPLETSLQYWCRVGGFDLERMLRAANYEEPAIVRFMEYFIEHIAPAWTFKGTQQSANPDEPLPSLNLDNSPIETGFIITSMKPNPTVRLLAEVDHTRAQEAIDEYCEQNDWGPILYDTDWVEYLYSVMMGGGGSSFFGDVRLGFDTRPALRKRQVMRGPSPGLQPIPTDVMAHFDATNKARLKGVTPWALIRDTILDLPEIDEMAPGIVSGVRMVDDFLAEYPPEAGNLISVVSTDPVEYSQACIGIYCIVPAGETSADFSEVWKWLTLGGRITALDDHRALLENLFDLVHGVYGLAADETDDSDDSDDSDDTIRETIVIDRDSSIDSDASVDSDASLADDPDSSVNTNLPVDLDPYLSRAKWAKKGVALPQVAPSSVYFALEGVRSEPTAMLRLDTQYNGRTDAEIAESVGVFLQSHGWPGPGYSYPALVQHCFAGIPLDRSDTKVHNSVSIVRQRGGGPVDPWAIHTGYNPLYYLYARP